MGGSFIDVTYNTGRTWRIVHPHPVGAVVRVEVLATILVETSAAAHLHCSDKSKYMLREGNERRTGQGLLAREQGRRDCREFAVYLFGLLKEMLKVVIEIKAKKRSFDGLYIGISDDRPRQPELQSGLPTPDTVSRYVHATEYFVRH